MTLPQRIEPHAATQAKLIESSFSARSSPSRPRSRRRSLLLPELMGMATLPEAPEPAVDVLKRRARRRLVGAIVLALAAAVTLPMLLESEPKPFGDDVSIKIPPIDSGRFVNPLSPEKADAPPAAPGAKGTISTPPPANEASDARRRPLERNASPAPVTTPKSSDAAVPPA